MYKLTITKYVENTNYEEELEESKRGYRNTPYPEKNIEVKSLVVELTDEEFAKMKKEVLTVFE